MNGFQPGDRVRFLDPEELKNEPGAEFAASQLPFIDVHGKECIYQGEGKGMYRGLALLLSERHADFFYSFYERFELVDDVDMTGLENLI